jgi:ribonuclease-3 family protein
MKFDHFKYLVDGMFLPDENGKVQKRYSGIDVRAINPLVLAYIGDAYFHLFVRSKLLAYEQNKVQVLNQFSAQIVSAVWQAKAYHKIETILTEEEKLVFKRARNAKSHAPRAASVAEYHMSTGFEALLGTLYLKKNYDRLHELAEASFEVISEAMMAHVHRKK